MASLLKRGDVYYAQVYIGGKQRRRSLQTTSLQIAKEKLRRIETEQAQGNDNPLPTRTPIGEVVGAYIDHIRTKKTAKSAQTDVYYLREAFGACCDQIQITSRRVTSKNKKRPRKHGQDQRCKDRPIEADCIEAMTTTQIQQFIDARVRSRGLAPKTANRYREIICRLFNWTMRQGMIRMPNQLNPASRVERYKEQASKISYLTLSQIDEQLDGLRFKPQLQTMVAMLIYAGLRREELIWLTLSDIDLSRCHRGYGLIKVRAKTIDGQSWQPKTAVNRAVPISSSLRAYLDRYTPPKTERPEPGDGFKGWYFPSPGGRGHRSGGGWWDPDNFSRELRAAQNEAGLAWTCLDYRHTFGSQLAQRGISLYKISSLMGNSPEICRRHYASVIPEAMHDEVDFAPANHCPDTYPLVARG